MSEKSFVQKLKEENKKLHVNKNKNDNENKKNKIVKDANIK